MSTIVIILMCIAVALLLLMLGSPVFICLGMAGVLGLFLNSGISGLALVQTTVFDSVSKSTLMAAPLFIFMGEIIFQSGMGTDLYNILSRVLRRLPGGLAVATVVASAIFGAMCGVSIAVVATIGVIALPEMLKRGYDPKLASGAVCAPGALAMLIPPSLLFILYGEVAGVSVPKLFTAGVLPGILLAVLMCGYIVIHEIKFSSSGLDVQGEPLSLKEAAGLFKGIWAPLLLIVGVLESIYFGIATPTESAAIGVVGAFVVAVIFYEKPCVNLLKETVDHAARVSSTILIIFIGTSMILITTPILLPVIKALHWDPIRFGVLYGHQY